MTTKENVLTEEEATVEEVVANDETAVDDVDAAVDEERPQREVTLSAPVAIGLAVLLVAALAASVVFGVLLLSSDSDTPGGSSGEEALATARSYAVTVTSYDYQNMDENIADVIDGATGEFRDQYSGASASLKALIKEAKATATGEVLQAGVKSASEDRAEVLLFVDQEVTNAASKKPQVDRNRVLMTLEKHDDRWLVSNLELL